MWPLGDALGLCLYLLQPAPSLPHAHTAGVVATGALSPSYHSESVTAAKVVTQGGDWLVQVICKFVLFPR